MFDRKKGFHPATIAFLLISGFFGLLGTSLIEHFFFSSDDAKTPVFILSLQILFGAVWIFALIIIVPVQTLYFRRKNRDDSSLPKASFKDFVGIFFGTYKPDAKLPKWISISVLSFLWLLVGIFVLGFVLCLIAFIFAPPAP